jgi:DNA integrity scanning protein DisA with diadenylate cyclase activity
MDKSESVEWSDQHKEQFMVERVLNMLHEWSDAEGFGLYEVMKVLGYATVACAEALSDPRGKS